MPSAAKKSSSAPLLPAGANRQTRTAASRDRLRSLNSMVSVSLRKQRQHDFRQAIGNEAVAFGIGVNGI